MGTGNYSATSNNMKLVHWPLMSGLLRLVERGGDWAGPQRPRAHLRCTKCNSPTHQRPVNQSPYFCIIVRCCAVFVPIKGLTERYAVCDICAFLLLNTGASGNFVVRSLMRCIRYVSQICKQTYLSVKRTDEILRLCIKF